MALGLLGLPGPMTAGWTAFHLGHPTTLDQAVASFLEPEVPAGGTENAAVFVSLRGVIRVFIGNKEICRRLVTSCSSVASDEPAAKLSTLSG